MTHADVLAQRRAELERRLASLTPEKRAQLERGRSGATVAPLRGGIAPGEPGTPVPMSYAQELLWLLDRANPGMHGYNVPRTARLRGVLDVAALCAALDGIVARHEVLRSTFDVVDGEARQIVHDPAPVALAVIDLSDRADARREPEARSLVRELSRRPFDLARDPQLRASLIRLGVEDHVLLLESHHISSDAWSRTILMRELSTLYDAHQRGEEADLAPLPIQYGDYARWQRDTLQGAELERHLAFWREQLRDAPTVLELPTDRARAAAPSFDGATRTRMLPPALLERLRGVSRAHGATLFVTLLAAFDVLLFKLSGQHDIVVGTPTAGRSQEATEELIGYFINVIALRARLDGDPTFAELLARVRETTLSAFEHQDVPFEKLTLEMQRARELGRHGLFQVMFTMQDAAEARTLQLAGLVFEPFGSGRGSTKFDLTLAMQEHQDGLRAVMEYRTDLFDAGTIDRMLAQLGAVLEGVSQAPSTPLSAIQLVEHDERELLLRDWAGPLRNYPTDTAIHALIEAQVDRTPDAPALTFEGRTLSYAQMDARANQLAHLLREYGVKRGQFVGVCLDRSFEMVVTLLAIMKAGAAYVPLDPEYPRGRLAFMLEDSTPAATVTRRTERASLPADAKDLVVLDDPEVNARLSGMPPSRRAERSLGDAIAYAIYTSGSTGRPKGAPNLHKAVVNRLLWGQETFQYTASDAVMQKTPYSFDVSVPEFFGPLLAGARLVIARPHGHRDPAYLQALIEQERITSIHFVPSMLEAFLSGVDPARLETLRFLMCSGEALSASAIARAYEVLPEAAEVHNLYGPTECAVEVTHWVCPRDPALSTVPIGRAVANTRCYVLDEAKRLVPVGVPGELYLAGRQVGAGYLRRPELTDERFVPDPYADPALEPHARMYRTGDRVRWLPDGTIEYLGRLDFQVKLRGLRIELGEIESALTQQPGVQSAVVLVREDTPSDQRLVAYCIAVPGADTSGHAPAALRRALKTTMPEFMVPTAFVWLAEWPLNASGKLDRKALPLPETTDAPVAERVTPRTPTEAVVAELWNAVLQCDVGAEDDFFELGGHSLLALRMLGRVAERFGVRVPLRVIFDASTVEAFARRVDELARVAAPDSTGGEIPRVGTEAPLTHMQELFWLVERNTPTLGVYNVAEQWQITGALDLHSLRHALDLLVERHEALRTNVVEREGGPVQVIGAARPVPLDLVDLAALFPDARISELRRAVAERSAAPFDLGADLLLRATLLRTAPGEHVLLLVSHHLVYDGWSRGVLLRELSALYARVRGERAPALPAIAVRLVDYAAWQRQHRDDGALAEELQGWLARLSGSTLAIDLPTDRPRPSVPSFEGGKRSTVFPPELLGRLRQLARETDATLFMVLLAGFQTLLHRYSGQQDLVVGTVVAGRARPELENIVGNFVNSVPLRASFEDDPTFLELLARVKDEYLHASEHAELPFETLNAALQRERGAEATGFAQVFFVLQNNAPAALRLSGTNIRSLAMETATTKFDLSLSIGEQAGGLRAAMQYRAALFDPSTIDRMLSHLGILLDGACRAPRARVSALPLLSADERHRLLVEWNDTTTDYPRDATVHELVAAQAARTPHAVAVSSRGQSLTYAELEARSNQLAWHLRGRGVEPGAVVGICIEPAPDLVVAMLASLKAGAAYLALDPTYPGERLAFMVQEANVAAIVTSGAGLPSVPLGSRVRVSMSADAAMIAAAPFDAPRTSTTGADLLNVVYTSGSTGRPKGAMLPHRGILRLVLNTDYMQLHADDVMAQMASPAFDALGLEVWGALLNGARVAIIPRDVMLDPSALKDEVRRAGVTSMFLTTAVFNQIARVAPDALRGVRNMFFGGEAADAESVRRVLEHSAPSNLRNVYGPTETSVFALSHPVAALAADATTVPIGRAIANTKAYVLDRRGQMLPVGVTGELYLGGDGTALGYLHRDELTAERFVRNPVVQDSAERLYRTGDLVRWLSSGAIEFIGRSDNQVKIRGVRIELSEIEGVVAADPDVSEALAMVRDFAPGDARLVCYYVPMPGASPDQARIRAALRRTLPQTMMPSAVIEVPAFPLTPNGKVDRRALPLPIERRLRTPTYKPPRTTIEHELVQIWELLLDKRPIGIREDFFELGGHSLLAVRMLAEIGRLRGRHVPLSWLFESSTIEALAARIDDEVQATKEPSLIALQADTPGTPLAFVHGDVRGAGWYCRRLAPLIAPDAPLFVLPTLGAEDDGRMWRIGTMAARHLAELRKVQPHGPYRLAGFCVGGMIAFEMARQLRNAGEMVERLILIDSTPTNARLRYMRPVLALMPGRDERARLARQAHLMKQLRRYELRLRQVSQLAVTQQMSWVQRNIVRRWRRLVGILRGRSNQTPAVTHVTDTSGRSAASLADAIGEQVLLSQAYAASSFIPTPSDITIDLIWAEGRPDVNRVDPTRGWWRLAKQVDVHPIVAHHIGLITNELPKLAAVLRTILERESR